jgi:hypothetical protein
MIKTFIFAWKNKKKKKKKKKRNLNLSLVGENCAWRDKKEI